MTRPRNESRSVTHYTTEKRSMTETLLETLTRGGLRPALAPPAAGASRRGWILAGGLLALLTLPVLGLLAFRSDDTPRREPVAVLELVHGSVELAGSGQDRSLVALAAGQPIQAGAVIDTRGAASPGRAALRLAGGHSVRLDHDTRVEVVSSTAVVLDRGAVYLDSAAAQSGIEVRTTLGVVQDVGTQFEVRWLGEVLRVRVREGEIVLEHAGERHAADAGTELTLRGDGEVVRGAVATHGVDWDWVLGIAPIPDFDGRPLRAFLDWAAREGGWELRFADAPTSELVASTTLNGDLDELTPVEAASVVFQGTRLAYRLDDGVFYVEPRRLDPDGGDGGR